MSVKAAIGTEGGEVRANNYPYSPHGEWLEIFDRVWELKSEFF